jgi:hypothetical protein
LQIRDTISVNVFHLSVVALKDSKKTFGLVLTAQLATWVKVTPVLQPQNVMEQMKLWEVPTTATSAQSAHHH